MTMDNVPWRDGIAAIVAGALLKILFDAVYRKIPLGFRRLRSLLDFQNKILQSFKDDQQLALKALQELLVEVHKNTVHRQPKRPSAIGSKRRAKTTKKL